MVGRLLRPLMGRNGRGVQTEGEAARICVASERDSLASATRARRRCLALLGGVASLGFAGAAIAATSAAAAPSAGPAPSFLTNFAGTKLIDQDGRRLQPEQLRQRMLLVNFVYTGCSTVCPVQTRALADLQQRLPRELRTRLRLLSISLDPLNDTPPALKAFALRMGADLSNWTFATGRPEDVERLSESLRLFRPDAGVRKPDDHSTALWLVDAQGQLRMRYSGNPPDVPRLLRELPMLDQLDRAPPK